MLPRVGVGGILDSWDMFSSWEKRTARTIRFFNALGTEGMVAPEIESHALMMSMARLSPAVLPECCEVDDTNYGMWLWLCDMHARHSAESVWDNFCVWWAS